MTVQTRIADDGGIEDSPQSGPLTWDGEPVYSPSTVREGLFAPEAFEQLPGQMSMPEPEPTTTTEPDNSPDAVEARRRMFAGFGWSVS